MFIFLTVAEAQTRNEKIEYLLSRIANEDADAVGELYDLVKDDVYAYALSKLRNSEDAEDVLHDTFVRIYRYASRYTPEGKPMAWIVTIAMNIAKRHRELKSRHISYDETIGEADAAAESFEADAVKSDFVRRLLQSLNEDEREIVVLHAVSGFKHREIAVMLHKSLGTVLSKYNRAIKKLRDIAEEEE